MNCRPGDLAVIVRTLPIGEFLRGRFCEVLRASEDFAGYWIVRLQTPIRNPLTGEVGDEGEAPDDALFPIRPNGITDDEVSELYAPTPEPLSVEFLQACADEFAALYERKLREGA